jgi:hypothetical protein
VKKQAVTEPKSGPAAKDVSLKSMIISAIWIGSLSLLKAFWGLITTTAFGLSMSEIVLSGVIMAAVFSPVYLSIVLDKIKDIKIG